MKPVRLVAWKEAEGEARRKELEGLGFDATFEAVDPLRLLRTLKDNPPSAVVVDLSRSPAQGRDLGVALRIHRSTRHTPLVFVGGGAEKVEGVRKVLPDAEFSSWERVRSALDRALSRPPADPVVPSSILAGYSGTPLPKKLGIKETTRVLLVKAPDDFLSVLGSLPKGAETVSRYGKGVGLILWFVRSRRDLEKDLGKWAARVGKGGIWIIWPKKSSGILSDLNQGVVRRSGLEIGLVDYKIAAVDQSWSGLKFAVRKKGAGDG